jgi:hypothetical protein
MIGPMLKCAAQSCDRPATRGEGWTAEHLGDIEQYRVGIRLGLTVKDIAVRLTLCDDHTRELTTAAWEPVLSKLTEWEWKPLPPSA